MMYENASCILKLVRVQVQTQSGSSFSMFNIPPDSILTNQRSLSGFSAITALSANETTIK